MPLPGTRPWLARQQLISSGNGHLDTLLGGGFVLGTLVLLLDETPSELLRYFIAQGVASGQKTLLVDSKSASRRLVERLPCSLTFAKEEKNASEGSAASESQLKIAWQYDREKRGASVKAANVEALGNFCHSFDLNSTLQKSLLRANPPRVLERDTSGSGTYYTDVLSALKDLTAGGSSVLRVALPVFFSESGCEEDVWSSSSSAVTEFFRFLLALRNSLRSIPAVVMMTASPLLVPPRLLRRMETAADTVLGVESFAGRRDTLPREFADLDGMLHCRKLQSVNILAGSFPSYSRYGMKRERRKLTIRPLHLPPEQSTDATYSVGCGAGGASDSGVLAF